MEDEETHDERSNKRSTSENHVEGHGYVISESFVVQDTDGEEDRNVGKIKLETYNTASEGNEWLF